MEELSKTPVTKLYDSSYVMLILCEGFKVLIQSNLHNCRNMFLTVYKCLPNKKRGRNRETLLRHVVPPIHIPVTLVSSNKKGNDWSCHWIHSTKWRC